MRELFASAKKVKPSIVFIDEIDSVGGKRHAFDHTHMHPPSSGRLHGAGVFSTESRSLTHSCLLGLCAVDFCVRQLRPPQDAHEPQPTPQRTGRI
jgi:SpoVK/Ycf46/Vps4 family AAA+-type ATPase